MSIERKRNSKQPKKLEGSIPFAYRYARPEWLVEFLKNKKILPRIEGGFISFSFSTEKIKEFGDIEIVFDLEKLERQGADSVDYDSIILATEDPRIIEYVTGYSEESYYKDINVKNAKEAKDAGELTWKEYLRYHGEDYEGEEEIIMEYLVYEPGLIRKVILPREIYERRKDIVKLLKDQNIGYEVLP
jgi:hypothetical protein